MKGTGVNMVRPGEVYRHFKGDLYQVVACAIHAETEEKMVVYQALYGDFKVLARPAAQFEERVDAARYPGAEQIFCFERWDATPGASKAAARPACSEEPSKEGREELIAFLDAPTCQEKLRMLESMEDDLDNRSLNSIMVSLDLAITESSPEERLNAVKDYLYTRIRFEDRRSR